MEHMEELEKLSVGLDALMVVEKLQGIATRFLEIAETTQNTTTAARALDVFQKAREAGKSIIKECMEEKLPSEYLRSISEPMLRSKLFSGYVSFCQVHKIPQYNKRTFFAMAISFGFQFKYYNGNWMAYTPQSLPKPYNRKPAQIEA